MNKTMTALLGFFLLLATAANAAEITVISGGAIEPGLKAAAAAFEKQTGHKVSITFNTTPQMTKRVAAGDTFDVIIAPPAAVKQFAAAGRVDAGGVDVGRVGSGIAVRPGAPVPAIATADDVKKAVLEAESIVFNTASTGIYFENLLKKWGIYDDIKGKAVRYTTGAEVMKHALKGKGRELAFGPITEILLEKEHGLILVGPFPAEIQNYTSYIAVPMSAGTQKAVAQELVKFLGGPVGKPLFVAAGIE
ncbi:MAG: substrate-binding domain-containing protein [Burkholderiales bacterium]|nr:substrate-binding domain-containing protein [Burkholderiales bacterium]